MPSRVAIAGLGLLGGSLGLALRRRSSEPGGPVLEVTGFDARPEAAATARARGACDRVATSLREAAAEAELLVLAAPVDAIVAQLHEIAHLAREGKVPAGLVVTDLGSTKRAICAAADEVLPPTVSFVGGHPLAGAERGGVEHARADLFDDAFWVVVPVARSDAESIGAVKWLVETAGGRVEPMEAGRHDRIVASTSHVPHLLAVTLAEHLFSESSSDHDFLTLAGRGFSDMTRIADGPPEVWLPIFGANADNVVAALAKVVRRLGALKDALESGQVAFLSPAIDCARRVRRELARRREG